MEGKMSEMTVCTTVLCPHCGHISDMEDAKSSSIFGGMSWTCPKCKRGFSTGLSLVGKLPGVSVSPENVTHVVYHKSGWVFEVEAAATAAKQGRLRFYDTKPVEFEPFRESEEEEAHWIASFDEPGVVALVGRPHLVKATKRKVRG
jgi:hypothetical protein